MYNVSACPHLRNPSKLGIGHADLRQMGGLAGRKGFYVERAGRLMDQVEVPCVHINDLQVSLGLESIDILSIDTEGSDFSLLDAYDLGGPGRAICVQSGWTCG